MMNRIVWHHTGGGYQPNAVDRRSYHKLIDGEARVIDGLHPISANAPGRPLTAGTYAAHTAGLNTGAIGAALCAMHGGVWADPRASSAFPKPAQIDAMIAESAQLCRQFGISPSRGATLSHAEVEITLGVKQRGKWDFDYPILKTATRDPVAIGDELRAELIRVLGRSAVTPPASARSVLRQGASGSDVRALQAALVVRVDGAFGPLTRAAVIAFQKSRNLLPDGVAGRMTWAALGL